MVDQQATRDALQAAERTPIAQLHPELANIEARIVQGEVTLTWPFSIVTRSIAFKLVESDFLLRLNKGQVRIEFHGAAGKAVAKAAIGGGDEVQISLLGANWEKSQSPVRPDTLDWQLKFSNRLRLGLRRAESREEEIVEVDETDAVEDEPPITPVVPFEPSTPEPSVDPIPFPLPQTAGPTFGAKRSATSAFEPDEFASPAFLKRAKVSYGSLFEGGLDLSDDERPGRRKKKRSRFSMHANWRYTSRSPSPEPEPQSELDEDDAEPEDNGEAAAAEEVVVEEPVGPSEQSPERTMVDEGSQTQDISVSVSLDAAANMNSIGPGIPETASTINPDSAEAHGVTTRSTPLFTPLEDQNPSYFPEVVDNLPDGEAGPAIANSRPMNSFATVFQPVYGSAQSPFATLRATSGPNQPSIFTAPATTPKEPTQQPLNISEFGTVENHAAAESRVHNFHTTPMNQLESDNFYEDEEEEESPESDEYPHDMVNRPPTFAPSQLEQASWSTLTSSMPQEPMSTRNNADNPIEILNSSSPVRGPSPDIEDGDHDTREFEDDEPEVTGSDEDQLDESRRVGYTYPDAEMVEEDELSEQDQEDVNADIQPDGGDLAGEDYDLRNYDRAQDDDVVETDGDSGGEVDPTDPDQQIVDFDEESQESEESEESEIVEADLPIVEDYSVSRPGDNEHPIGNEEEEEEEEEEEDEEYDYDEGEENEYEQLDANGEDFREDEYDSERYHEDEEPQESEDEEEEEEEYTSRAPPSQEPVFISLLSDSEDDADDQNDAPSSPTQPPPSAVATAGPSPQQEVAEEVEPLGNTIDPPTQEADKAMEISGTSAQEVGEPTQVSIEEQPEPTALAQPDDVFNQKDDKSREQHLQKDFAASDTAEAADTLTQHDSVVSVQQAPLSENADITETVREPGAELPAEIPETQFIATQPERGESALEVPSRNDVDTGAAASAADGAEKPSLGIEDLGKGVGLGNAHLTEEEQQPLDKPAQSPEAIITLQLVTDENEMDLVVHDDDTKSERLLAVSNNINLSDDAPGTVAAVYNEDIMQHPDAIPGQSNSPTTLDVATATEVDTVVESTSNTDLLAASATDIAISSTPDGEGQIEKEVITTIAEIEATPSREMDRVDMMPDHRESPTLEVIEPPEPMVIDSPPITQEKVEMVGAERKVDDDAVETMVGKQESGQLPTPLETQREEDAMMLDQDDETSEADYSFAAEQQIMDESQAYATSQQLQSQVSENSEQTQDAHPQSSTGQTSHRTARSKARGRPSYEILITADSLRSADHRRSGSPVVVDDDPSIVLAQDDVDTQQREKDEDTQIQSTPMDPVSPTGENEDDPSLHLAAADDGANADIEKASPRTLSPVNVRVTRSMDHQDDPSLHLAKETEPSPERAGEPRGKVPTSPTVHITRSMHDQEDSSVPLATEDNSGHEETGKLAPDVNVRVTRSKDKEGDPSLHLAAQVQTSPKRSNESQGKITSSPTVHITRSMGKQADPSLHLATEVEAGHEETEKLPLSTQSPTVRVNRSKDDDTEHPSAHLAKVNRTPTRRSRRVPTPEPMRETRATSRNLRSKTPESVVASVTESTAVNDRASALKVKLVRDLRQTLPEFLPLKGLRNSLHKIAHFIGVATITPGEPHRPKGGPRDYMMDLTLTDPASAPSNVTVVSLIHQYRESLPTVHAGDIVLLRGFEVISMAKRGFGLRVHGDSAWAIFEKGSEEMLPQIKGPPVEVLDEEVTYAENLRNWWSVLDEEAKGKLEKATEKVVQAAKELRT